MPPVPTPFLMTLKAAVERAPRRALASFLLLHVAVWTVLPTLLYPNLPLDLKRGPSEVDPRLGLGDLGGVGDALIGLDHWRMLRDIVQHLDHQVRARMRQFGGQRTRRLALNLGHIFGPHRPGIQASRHVHDRDPGDIVARQDRPLDRRRPTPARQQ